MLFFSSSCDPSDLFWYSITLTLGLEPLLYGAKINFFMVEDRERSAKLFKIILDDHYILVCPEILYLYSILVLVASNICCDSKIIFEATCIILWPHVFVASCFHIFRNVKTLARDRRCNWSGAFLFMPNVQAINNKCNNDV